VKRWASIPVGNCASDADGGSLGALYHQHSPTATHPHRISDLIGAIDSRKEFKASSEDVRELSFDADIF
jgi:hypothetical protein